MVDGRESTHVSSFASPITTRGCPIHAAPRGLHGQVVVRGVIGLKGETTDLLRPVAYFRFTAVFVFAATRRVFAGAAPLSPPLLSS